MEKRGTIFKIPKKFIIFSIQKEDEIVNEKKKKLKYTYHERQGKNHIIFN